MRRLLLTLSLPWFGCATSMELTTPGSQIWVSDREVLAPGCAFVRGVRCEKGGVYGAEENTRLCTNNLRNQAAALGGTHLVFNRTRERGSMFHPNTNTQLGTRCLGCVAIEASVFRCDVKTTTPP